MPNKQGFPPLDSMPMLAYAISGALDASKEQLGYLTQAKNKPYVLDNQTIRDVIRSYTKYIDDIADEKAICLYWKKQTLTTEQRIMLKDMLESVDEMEAVNQEILSLAHYCKDYTIEKIMDMEPIDLIMADITGKFSPSISEPTSPPKADITRKQVKLPSEVTYQQTNILDGICYSFRHIEWGDIGRIEVIYRNNKTTLNPFGVTSDSRDPLHELRYALFRTIAQEFNLELEEKFGESVTTTIPTKHNAHADKRLIESKAMVCLTCDTPVALLIFAPEATTASELEDHARMMYTKTVEMNLPTWVIGKEEEIIVDEEALALILKVWPKREQAKKISSLDFEPMLHKLQTRHCR